MQDNNSSSRVLELLLGSPTGRRAIPSICTAHPDVLRIALGAAALRDEPILIEATCNQVNQEGGYTGQTPEAFRGRVLDMAQAAGLKPGRLILGGDHLGPNPWKALPAEQAMAKAEAMIAAYVRAGFRKLHLDTSMGCAGEAAALDDATVAKRAARLSAVAEAAAKETGGTAPVYIIGTEVPPPGGATDAADHLAVTKPAAVLQTMEVHRAEFRERGLNGVLDRIVGIVVQPGVEFGDQAIHLYQSDQAQNLKEALNTLPGIVFEAHSTDYQPLDRLDALAQDGFAILKVGPALTFAWREAIYGLDQIHAALTGEPPIVAGVMEKLMLENPKYWQPYYSGSADNQRLQRHFSYSDRIRYYWPLPEARNAVSAMLERLGDKRIPETLIGQFLGRLYDVVVSGAVQPIARELIAASVASVLDAYRQASLSR